MDEMDIANWIKLVGAENNGDFISIQAYSGCESATAADPEANEYLFLADTPNDTIGTAVLEALNQSRFLDEEESHSLEKKAAQNYTYWIQKIMHHFVYKDKREIFMNMKSCSVHCFEDTIFICPSHHEDLEVWSNHRVTDDDCIKVPINSSPADIGAALRLAFTRCTG